jgi:hypothetical protein
VELERAAADGLHPKPRDHEEPRGRPELVELGGDAARRIEPVVEPAPELRDVCIQARLRVRGRGIDDRELDQRCAIRSYSPLRSMSSIL